MMLTDSAHEAIRAWTPERLEIGQSLPVYAVEASLAVLGASEANVGNDELVQRAGATLADFAIAVGPHKDHVWLACGPGRIGKYGLEAAKRLSLAGKSVFVGDIHVEGSPCLDRLAALQTAKDAGVEFTNHPPGTAQLIIDALTSIEDAKNPTPHEVEEAIRNIHHTAVTVISVDLPSGLCPNTGQRHVECVKADYTLSLFNLKPGLFLAHGKDMVGDVWLSDLGFPILDTDPFPKPDARLIGDKPKPSRIQNSHKGTYGDVTVVGGARGMVGAAILAGTAALYCGAGRVKVCLIGQDSLATYFGHPELMIRSLDTLDFGGDVLVCGCGGGEQMTEILPSLLWNLGPIVIDADALNAIASHKNLADLLCQRSNRGSGTVITPHPLEAARLLDTTVGAIQADRLQAGAQLAIRFNCVAVLKGAGTVVTSPDQKPSICPTGNSRLSTAGTGDVLAGMIAANLAQGMDPMDASLTAVFRHGQVADHWPLGCTLTADQLARSL